MKKRDKREIVEVGPIRGVLLGIKNGDCFVKLTRPLTAYKKVGFVGDEYKHAILELKIPKGATVYVPHGELVFRMFYSGALVHKKLRADKAKVVKVFGRTKSREFVALHDNQFIYRVGKTVKPKRKFSRRYERCASGIHFYLAKQGAINH